MTPTKKKRLAQDKKSVDVEECSICYAHRDYPEGMSAAATNTRCFLYPTAMQVVKNHWCAQWKQIKEKSHGLP